MITIIDYTIDESETPWRPDSPYRLVLTVEGLPQRPVAPWFAFGDTFATDGCFHPDGRTYIGWMYTMPEDGAELIVGFGDEPGLHTGVHHSSS